MSKNVKDKWNRQYITTEQCVIIEGIKEYKTLVKKLAAIDLEIMDLVKRHQQIKNLQRKLIKEWKDNDMKSNKKIVMKCSLEKAKFAIFPSVHVPAETSPQPNPVVQITVPHSKPQVSKWNSDTWQIGDVKKIWKELFPNDNVDDNILATAAAEAESAL